MQGEHEFRAEQAVRRAGFDRDVSSGCAVTGPPGSGTTTVLTSLAGRVEGPTVWVSGVRRSAELVFAHLPAVLAAGETSLAGTRWAVARQLSEDRAGALVVDDAHLLDDDAGAIVHSLAVHDGVPTFVACSVEPGARVPDAIRALWKDGHLPRYELALLGVDEVRAYVEHVVGAPVTSRDVDSLMRWSQGRPSLLVELVASSVADDLWAVINATAVLTARPAPPTTLVEELKSTADVLPEDVYAIVEVFAVAAPVLGGRLLDWLPLAPLIDVAGMDTLVEAERAGVIVVDGARVRLASPFLADAIAGHTPTLRRAAIANRLSTAVTTSALHGSEIGSNDLVQTIAGLLTTDASHGRTLSRTQTTARSALRLGDPTMVRSLISSFYGSDATADIVDPELAVLYGWASTDLNDTSSILTLLARWNNDQSPRWRGFIEFFTAYFTRRETGSATFLRQHDQHPDGLRGAVADWIDRDRLSGVWFGYLVAETAILVGRYSDARSILDAVMPHSGDNGLLVFSLTMIELRLETMTAGADAAAAKAETARSDSAWRSDHVWAAADYTCAVAHVCAGRLDVARTEIRDCAPFVAGPALDGAPTRLMDRIDRMTGVDGPTRNAGVAPSVTADPYSAQLGGDTVVDQAWETAVGGRATAAVDALLEFGDLAVDAAPTVVVDLIELAARFVSITDRRRLALLVALAERVEGRVETARRMRAVVDYCRALLAGEGGGVEAAAQTYRRLGLRPVAADAFAQAAALFRADGDSLAAAAATTAAHRLTRDMGGLASPAQTSIAPPDLTRREREIVRLASQALSNQQIADRLHLSVRTVEGHILRASAKFGVQDRRALVAAWEESDR